MCTRREGTIAGALGHSLLELTLLRRGERRECDAQILLRCGGVQQPKSLLDLSCARRDRVAVHAMACSSTAAQRDARGRAGKLLSLCRLALDCRPLGGRGVCLLLASRWLATFARCTCGRAVPAVRNGTALGLRVVVDNAHCDAGLLAERGQVLLIAQILQNKRWHSAGMQRRWITYSLK